MSKYKAKNMTELITSHENHMLSYLSLIWQVQAID